MARRTSVMLALAFCACAGESASPVDQGRSQSTGLEAASLQSPFFGLFAVPSARDAGPAASEAEQFVTLGNRVFFVARAVDRLVWVTDGTDQGTAPVSTFSLDFGYPSSTAKLVAFDGGVFFAAVDRSPQTYGAVVWVRTEGDPEHTQVLQPVRSFAPTGEQVVFGGALYVVATDFDHGEELWKGDGTESGTTLFTDIRSNELSSSPANLTVVGSTLFFTADDGLGRTLWKTDGTPGGTVKVGAPDAGLLNPSNLSVSNGKLFFGATGPGGNEPWISDGTPAGTMRLVDTVPGPDGSNPHGFVAAGTSTAFLAGPAPYQEQLWRWNGSAATVETDGGSLGSNIIALDRSVLYTVFGPPATGLWASDGTSAPEFLHPLYGHYAGQMIDPVVFDQKVFFGSSEIANPDIPDELWVSDGTAGGTHAAFGPALAAQAANPHRLAATPLGLLFSAGRYDWLYSFFQVSELWLSDGSASGAHPIIAPVAAGSSSMPGTPVVSGSDVFWGTGEYDLQTGLWHADARGNAMPIPGIQPGTISQLVPVPGGVLATNQYFSGSLLLVNPDGGAQSLPLPPFIAGWAALDASTVFATYGNFIDPGAAWVSDGTVAGTQRLPGLPADGGADNPFALTRFGDSVYFLAGSPLRLFSTDGGTSSVVFELPANEYFSGGPPWPVTVMDNHLYFATAQRMYVSDGTAAREAFPFEYFGAPQRLYATSSRLLYSVAGMLFSSDGTDAGAQVIAGSPSQPFDFTPLGAVGDRLYFRHREWDAHGTQTDGLWTTDGTDAGTRFVASVGFDDPGFAVDPLIALPLESEGRIVFPARGRFAGSELWVSDGTEGGTRPVVEIARGPLPSRPGLPARFGDRLLVPAETHVSGRELWSIDLAAVTDNVPPELTCPANVNDETADSRGKAVSFTPVAHDAVSEVRITTQPSSGSTFPIGTTQVHVRATDAFGNARTCEFSVTVTRAMTNPPPPVAGAGKSGCTVAGGGSPLGNAPLALLALLVLARRRNRARRDPGSNARA